MFSSNYKRHENHLVPLNDKSILRTSLIYGANASGKTNILLSLRFLQELIVIGTHDVNSLFNLSTFKLDGFKVKPTTFKIEFKSHGRWFHYEVVLQQNEVLSEELNEVKSSGTDVLIFKRHRKDGRTKLTISPNRKKQEKEKLREELYAEELRPNQLFLNEAYNQKSMEIVKAPFEWFAKQLNFVSLDEIIPNSHSNYHHHGLAATFYLDEKFLEVSRKIITKANVGISDIRLTEVSLKELKSSGVLLNLELERNLLSSKQMGVDVVHNGDLYSSFRRNDELCFVKITLIHSSVSGESVEFKYSEESRGVQRLFELLPALYRSLHGGEIFMIDEIETSFHPVLIREILSLYLKAVPENSGQIIFTTHESHLMDLDLLRQDEIWFCEKTQAGSTSLYSLAEFNPRFDKDIRKGYLSGKYGFIPFLGEVVNLG